MLCRNSTGGDGVTKIKVVHSNGSIILDKAAIGALKKLGISSGDIYSRESTDHT
jgi:hypothetical protein